MICSNSDLLWVAVWATIGSISGFFSIRNKPEWTNRKRISQLILSITVGVLFALPTYQFLYETKGLSNRLSTLIAGAIAFGVFDIIVSLWGKLKSVLSTGLEKGMDKLLSIIVSKGK